MDCANVKTDTSKTTVVKGVGGKVKLTEWATFDLFIPGTIEGVSTIGQVTVSAWVSDNLDPHLLLGNEFLHPHGAAIDYAAKTVTLQECNLIVIPVTFHHRGKRTIRKVTSKQKEIIPPYSSAYVAIKCAPLPEGRCFMFEGSYPGAPDAIVNHCNFVAIINAGDKPLIIHAKTKLGKIREFEEDGGYLLCDSYEHNPSTTSLADIHDNAWF